jgi:hypothetical protein
MVAGSAFPVFILFRAFRWDAIGARNPVTQINHLAALSAKWPVWVSIAIDFFAAARAFFRHVADA